MSVATEGHAFCSMPIVWTCYMTYKYPLFGNTDLFLVFAYKWFFFWSFWARSAENCAEHAGSALDALRMHRIIISDVHSLYIACVHA